MAFIPRIVLGYQTFQWWGGVTRRYASGVRISIRTAADLLILVQMLIIAAYQLAVLAYAVTDAA